jgi:hypothetical protein
MNPLLGYVLIMFAILAVLVLIAKFVPGVLLWIDNGFLLQEPTLLLCIAVLWPISITGLIVYGIGLGADKLLKAIIPRPAPPRRVPIEIDPETRKGYIKALKNAGARRSWVERLEQDFKRDEEGK